MIKSGLHSFWKNILYAFIPMGILYFSIILAAYTLLSGLWAQGKETFTDVYHLISRSPEISEADMQDFLEYSYEKIDWESGAEKVLGQVADSEWLSEHVKGFFEQLHFDVEASSAQFTELMQVFRENAIETVYLSAILLALGIGLANFVTRFIIRRKNARRTLKKMVLTKIFSRVFSWGATIATLILTFWMPKTALLVFLITVLIDQVQTIMIAWMVYGKGKIPLRDVLTWNNVLQSLGLVAIVFAMDAAVFGLLCLLHPVIGILILFPMILYSQAVLTVHAEAFIRLQIEPNEQVLGA